MTTADFNHFGRTVEQRSRGPAARASSALSLPLLAILERHDDRLLTDAGLSRDDVLGPQRSFWRNWLRTRDIWNL